MKTAEAAPAGQNANASADILSSLEGRTKIRNGVVSTEQLRFQMPGAGVDLNGTYNLHDRTVHMLGDLRMQADGTRQRLDRVIWAAFERGVTFFDTAEAYGLGKSERILGEEVGVAADEAGE